MPCRCQALVMAFVAAAVMLAPGCGGGAGPRIGPDGKQLPRTIAVGTIKDEAINDRSITPERPLKPAELRALEVFFQVAELHEPDLLMADAIGSELTLDGVVWVAYHDGLFQKSIGHSKQLHVPSAPRWAGRNYASMDVLVEWARKQDRWRDP